jgi:tRNA(fMet)-specific endonuclease VapC
VAGIRSSNRALLDTDTLSEIGKGINPTVASHATTYRRAFGFYTLSVISVTEIVRGHQQASNPMRLNAFLASIATQEILSFDQDAAELAGRISGDLERNGQSIGIADPMIAATAIHHGLELVTGNTAHFERIQRLGYKLTLINWRV